MAKQTDHQPNKDTILNDKIRITMEREFMLPEQVEKAKQQAFAQIRAKQKEKQSFVMEEQLQLVSESFPEKEEKIAKFNPIKKKTVRKKWGMLRRSMTGLAAAAAAFTLVCVYDSALAAQIPILGRVFIELGQILSFGGDYSEYAKPLEQGMTVDGVNLTFSELYANDVALYLSVVITMEEPFPDTMVYEENGQPALELVDCTVQFDFAGEQEIPLMGVYPEGYFVDEYTYAGVMRQEWADISRYYDSETEEMVQLEIPEQFQMKLSVGKIAGDKIESTFPAIPGTYQKQYYEKMKEHGMAEYVAKGQLEVTMEGYDHMTPEQKKIEHEIWTEIWNAYVEIYPEAADSSLNKYRNYWFDGPWEYEFDIHKDNAKSQTIEVKDVDEAGYGILSVTKTPFEITAVEQCPEGAVTFVAAFDAQGKRLVNGNTIGIHTWSVMDRDVSEVHFYILEWNTYMDLKKDRDAENFEEIIAGAALYDTRVKML